MRLRHAVPAGLAAVVLLSSFVSTSAATTATETAGAVGAAAPVVGTPATVVARAQSIALGADEVLVGAAKVDLEPRPGAGETWVRDRRACTPLTSGDAEGTLTHAPDTRMPWAENTNCIYMGGFGIGPSQPVLEWDSYTNAPVYRSNGDLNERGYGLWARSMAFQRDGKAVVLTILDAEGWFWAYNAMCPPEKACGFSDIQEQLAAETGLARDSFIFASTHAHSAMDFIGGWGGVPTWYMRQAAESLRDSVRAALGAIPCPSHAVCVAPEPATIEAGETLARDLNRERRNFYRSAEDPTINWVRALSRPDAEGQRRVLATAITYAAHPVSFGASATVAHGDYPAVFAKRIEERHPGSIGLAFPAGLGNMSTSGGWRIGARLADRLPGVGGGTIVTDPAVKVKLATWKQPITNVPLGTLGAARLFDRAFGGPASVQAGKNPTKPCRSAAPTSVETSVTAATIGGVVITAAPGEIFANYSNTIEERGAITALAIGQANDALGYLPQSFETDHLARQGLGFNGNPRVTEYEDAYSLDACFGDVALETTLTLLGSL